MDAKTHHEGNFISYPTNRVVGTIADAESARSAIEALLQAGVDREDIDILHGEEDLRRLDPSGASHGFLAQFQRTLIRLAGPVEESAHLRHHVEDVRAGRFVIMVLAKGQDRRDLVAGILNAHGAEFMGFYGRWAWASMSGGNVERTHVSGVDSERGQVIRNRARRCRAPPALRFPGRGRGRDDHSTRRNGASRQRRSATARVAIKCVRCPSRAPTVRLTHRIRTSESRQTRRRQARSLVGCDLPKSSLSLPIVARLCDLFCGPRHEVPPHQDRLRKGRATNEQHAATVLAGEARLGPVRSKVYKTRSSSR